MFVKFWIYSLPKAKRYPAFIYDRFPLSLVHSSFISSYRPFLLRPFRYKFNVILLQNNKYVFFPCINHLPWFDVKMMWFYNQVVDKILYKTRSSKEPTRTKDLNLGGNISLIGYADDIVKWICWNHQDMNRWCKPVKNRCLK